MASTSTPTPETPKDAPKPIDEKSEKSEPKMANESELIAWSEAKFDPQLGVTMRKVARLNLMPVWMML